MSANQGTLSGDETEEEPLQEVPCDCISFASWPELLAIANGSEKALVWPDEGRFTPDGAFEFNSLHGNMHPLRINKICAVTMRTLHDRLNEVNQARFEDIVATSRLYFIKLRDLSKRIT